VPGRWFSVKAIDGRYARVNEVFGFFQTSFVKALTAWGFAPPTEIATMKQARGTFTAADLRRVTDYCLHECRLLVELMDALRAACDRAGITPKQWIGAGSIATALLGRQDMDCHHVYDLDLAEDQVVQDAVLGAYFGGRVELLRQGVFNAVSSADIRSAYPAAATSLPSLQGASLVWRRRFVSPPAHGIWRCRWNLPKLDTRIAPFPVRRKHSIFYPLAGEGFYHSIEVQAALDAGHDIRVIEGWLLWETTSAARPFDWIRQVYAERRRLKAAGHAAEKVVKLGLNSIYGKLAQGCGYNARPRWQSYFWAGYVTAATRAKMLTLAAACADPLMISTDGVFSGAALAGLGRGNGLGSWERGSLERLFTAQPGVYQGVGAEGEIFKSRGFFAAEVDYDELRQGFELEGSDYVHTYDSTRFIGLGAALARREFGVWRQWKRERRKLLLHPERKVIGESGRLYPYRGRLESEPYQPKVSLLDARAVDYMQGMEQPMREVI